MYKWLQSKRRSSQHIAIRPLIKNFFLDPIINENHAAVEFHKFHTTITLPTTLK